MGLAEFQASILEKLPGRLLTRDQLILLSHDNVVGPAAATLSDLGIVAAAVEQVVPSYLARFRQGGSRPERYAAS